MNKEEEQLKIKQNPYDYVCEYAESLYPHTGRQVFEIASLMPISLMLDDFPYFDDKQKMNINMLFLAPSGSAKSKLSRLFEEFAYFPIMGKSYTPAELINTIKNQPVFSLIIEDLATMARDEELLKILESILGEEKNLDRHTKTQFTSIDVNGIGFMCGVPDDLTSRLTSGLIFRTIVVIVLHDEFEHSEIGKHLSRMIGIESKESIKKEIIKEYYHELQKILSGLYPDKPPIMGYEIDQKFRDMIYNTWDSRTIIYRKNAQFNWHRELLDAYRIMISHASLNYFNRKIVNNKIIIQDEDCRMACKFLEKSLEMKYSLLMMEELSGAVRSINQLMTLKRNPKTPQLVKELMPIYMKNKIKH